MMEKNLAADLHAISHRAEDVDDGASDGTLPTPGLPDKSQRFTLIQIEAHAIDRAHFRDLSREDTTDDREAHGQVLDLEKLGLRHGETKWQRTQWPGLVSSNFGSMVSHFSRLSVQRVTNLQPTGRSRMLGTLPGIVRRRRCFSPSTTGSEASKPRVYG